MDSQIRCPQCGAANRSGQAYCHGCGALLPPAAYQQPPYVAAQRRGTPVLTCLAIGCGVLVLLFFVMVFASALPNYVRVKDKAKEAEVKANLHNIQLSLERFAVDADGQYPAYLVGGSADRTGYIDAAMQDSFTGLKPAMDVWEVSDPLIREAYMGEYPRNPFTRSGIAIHQLQEQLDGTSSDPARNGVDSGRRGTRFGPECDLMGSVLADPRYPKWSSKSGKAGLAGDRATHADVEYRFWDMWDSDEPLPFLPGQFFYKSAGKLQESDAKASATKPVAPQEVTLYMLGAYGGLRSKGKDVIGEENPVAFSGGRRLWHWTRSEVGSGQQGSPYSPPAAPGSSEQLQFGNPNGIRDGIILVLTSGEDYVGDR